MSVMCKSCGKFIMSVFKDTCDDCVAAQVEQDRKYREREARNERTRLDALRVNSLRDSRQQSDDISLHAATIALWADTPSSSSRYGSNVDTTTPAWTPPASTYTPAESCGSSYDSSSYSSSSCSDSSGGGGGGGGD